jgi:hypothetical protein
MTSKRKRNTLVILLVVSFLLNLIFLTFAYVQKAIADDMRIVAWTIEQKVHDMEKLVHAERASAVQAREATEQTLNDCLKDLESTQKKKK